MNEMAEVSASLQPSWEYDWTVILYQIENWKKLAFGISMKSLSPNFQMFFINTRLLYVCG